MVVPKPRKFRSCNVPFFCLQVTLVRWNEPYQKLASCDTSGIIFVWIKYEGRWSIELINDRNTPVICFSWSHDGRMALICYQVSWYFPFIFRYVSFLKVMAWLTFQDGFVLVGSVAGQRYWSTLLPDVNNITSGVWTPDDQHVYLGTTQVKFPLRPTVKVMFWWLYLFWHCVVVIMTSMQKTDTTKNTIIPGWYIGHGPAWQHGR